MSMTEESHLELITKKRLTKGERRYIEARNWLRLEREAHHERREELQDLVVDDHEMEDGQDPPTIEEERRESAETYTDPEIKNILKEHKFGYPKDADREMLINLFVELMDKLDKEDVD